MLIYIKLNLKIINYLIKLIFIKNQTQIVGFILLDQKILNIL